MPDKTLNLESLRGLDAGQAGKMFDSELARVVADFDQRGEADLKKRTVTLKIEMWHDPELGKDGEDRAIVTVQGKIPPYTTAEVKGRTKRDGNKVRFLFQDIAEIEDDEETDDAREAVVRAAARKTKAEPNSEETTDDSTSES